METKFNWDWMGIATSVGCAIHCAVLPVLVTTLPVFGINIIHNAWFEWFMIGLAFFVGAYALVHSHIRHHHSFLPLYFFSGGFVFLIMKQFFHPYESWFLLIAVPLIVGAHYYNYRLSYKGRYLSSHHKQ